MVTQTYGARNAILLEMGFANYKAYLASPKWALIRFRAWLTHGRICRICKAPADVLHHIGYNRDTLEGRNLDSLVPLCNGCHLAVEFDGRGNKRTFVSAHTTYVKLLKGSKASSRKKRGKPGWRNHGECWRCGRDLNRRLPTCPACRGVRKTAV